MAGYNGSGTFVRSYNWADDANNGVGIQAARFDTEMDGIATGLSNAICKDGQSAIQADIPFNNHTATGLRAPTASGDAMNVAAHGVNAPGGRLSLSSIQRVPVSALTTGTLYYLPYVGNTIPLWNGVLFVPSTFSALSNVLADSSAGNAGPAAAIANSAYDLFVWSNAGVPTLTRGPAWTSVTGRSMALTVVNGLLVNSSAITNGPGAAYGTYIGSVATDASGATVTFDPGSSASGGGAAWIGLWNFFNRRNFTATVKDSATSHTYASGTIRPFNNSVSNRVTFFRGVNEDGILARGACRISTAASVGSFGAIGLGLDSTSAYWSSSCAGIMNATTANSIDGSVETTGASFISIGLHYIQLLEQSDAIATTVTFLGATWNSITVISTF